MCAGPAAHAHAQRAPCASVRARTHARTLLRVRARTAGRVQQQLHRGRQPAPAAAPTCDGARAGVRRVCVCNSCELAGPHLWQPPAPNPGCATQRAVPPSAWRSLCNAPCTSRRFFAPACRSYPRRLCCVPFRLDFHLFGTVLMLVTRNGTSSSEPPFHNELPCGSQMVRRQRPSRTPLARRTRHQPLERARPRRPQFV